MDKALKYLTPIVLKAYYNQHTSHRFLNPILGTKTSTNFVVNFLKSKRLIYFGEIHGVPSIVQFQETVLDFLVREVRDENSREEEEEEKDDDEDEETATNGVHKIAKVVVIMEHFAGARHQSLLDLFMKRETDDADEKERMSLQSFIESYRQGGEEGHNLEPYWNLLNFARRNADVVELKAGFIPRSYAKLLVNEGADVGLEAAYKDGFLDRQRPYKHGSENHYNFFESLISGRDLSSHEAPPSDRYRRIFPAQIIKDSAMAHVVIREARASKKNRLLVICGSGHCEYRFGVPERVDEASVIPEGESCVISTRHVDHYEIDWKTPDDDQGRRVPFENVENFETKHPADLLYFYDDVDDDDVVVGSAGETSDVSATRNNNVNTDDGVRGATTATHDVSTSSTDHIKTEIAGAYDQVGETAHIEGDSKLAATVMKFLEYTDEQIRIAGRDAFNYQGVGNPHKHARISRGDRVLDLGSGLGVDSFIAAARVGDTGTVVGLDISKGEVVHASKRAKARGVDRRVQFVNADMEKVPLPDDSVDVVISNGAFCLAPDKEKAFQEIFRVLKPGGHFSVACTTLLKELDSDVNWPICMRVFMPLMRARPMLDHVGFREVTIDSSNSLMTYALEVEEDAAQNGGSEGGNHGGTDAAATIEGGKDRKKIHVGSEEFKHLENFDMNQLCARVILCGKKPDNAR